MPDTNITVMSTSTGNRTSGNLASMVKRAFDQAIAGTTKLPPEVMAIRGMSGKKYRTFINALVESLENPKYLEVGSWMGSTLCSAIHGNDVEAVAIDNWSQFGGPSDDF